MLRTAFATSVALAVCASCSRQPTPASASPERKPAPESAQADRPIRFQYAIYYLPSPSRDPLPALRAALSEGEAMLRIVDEMPDDTDAPVVCAHSSPDVQESYAPPDMRGLQYAGRGLTREQAEQLQNSRHAFIMDFAHPKTKAWDALLEANKISESLAREGGGLLWDEETREVFTPDEWRKRRIDSWAGPVPNISDHFTIHAYNSGEYVRAITLGMSKVGLSDVVVQEFSWSLSRTVGHLINLVCQSMAEGSCIDTPGEFDLDLRAIRNKEVRDSQLESLKAHATAVALLTLRKGTREEGDPRNRLIEIGFDRYRGHDVHARQANMLSSMFGWEDAATAVKHDEQVLAASRRAKAQLPVLRKEFSNGLEPGEFIQVKAPFPRPGGGNEWMWVEIAAWEGKKIRGLLRNEPSSIPSLHAGQIVEVDQDDVFDYLRHRPDGREEGNETGAIFSKMRQEKGE